MQSPQSATTPQLLTLIRPQYPKFLFWISCVKPSFGVRSPFLQFLSQLFKLMTEHHQFTHLLNCLEIIGKNSTKSFSFCIKNIWSKSLLKTFSNVLLYFRSFYLPFIRNREKRNDEQKKISFLSQNTTKNSSMKAITNFTAKLFIKIFSFSTIPQSFLVSQE